jgi:hypothetical protein
MTAIAVPGIVLPTTPRCTDTTHRSYSSDRGFDECQFRDALYRQGLARPKASRVMVEGSATDEAIGVVLAGRKPDVAGIVAQLGLAEGIPTERHAQMTEKVAALLTLWTDRVWPTYPPVYAYQYEIHWEHEGIVCHAHLDVVFDDGSLIDLKTSEKRLPTNRADTDEQLTWYAWAMREAHGVQAMPVGLDGLIYANPPSDVKSWQPDAVKPWYDRQRSRRGPTELDELARTVARREHVRGWLDATGQHLPNGRSAPFACGDCPVIAACPAWRGYVLEEIIDAD